MIHVGQCHDFRRAPVLRVTIKGTILEEAGFRVRDAVEVRLLGPGALAVLFANPVEAKAARRLSNLTGWQTRRLRARSFGVRPHCWRKDMAFLQRAWER